MHYTFYTSQRVRFQVNLILRRDAFDTQHILILLAKTPLFCYTLVTSTFFFLNFVYNPNGGGGSCS